VRFAIALVTLLIAGVLVATGVAQRTILKPDDHVTVSADVPSDVHYVVVPGSVLQSHQGQQRLHLAGASVAFAAYGRSSDVVAWLSGQRYARLGVDRAGALTAPVVATAPVIAGLRGGTPDPNGADLWIDQQRSTSGALDWNVDVPKSMSLIVASTGAAAAPSDLRLTWPVSTHTPLAVPLIVAGGALAVVGLLLYLWALVHVRRQRGPRRKSPPKMPKRPQPPKYRPQRPTSAAPAPERGRRSVRQRVALGWAGATTVLVGALLVPTAGPALAATAPTVAGASLTETQATRIVTAAARTAKAADHDLDAKALAARFTGPALDLRSATYTIRKKDSKQSLPATIPTTGAVMKLIEPEATTAWPRTLFATVAQGTSKTVAPVSVALIQNDPRSAYKVQYAMRLIAGRDLPNLPSALDGARRLDAAAQVLEVEPGELAADYGSVLTDSGSATASEFPATDPLLKAVGEAAKKRIAKKLGSTAGITFKDLKADPSAVIAMSTANAGALVAVQLDEQWTVKPKKSGVTVKPSGGTKILSKRSSTSKGIVSVYGYQLLFAVPSAGSKEPVVLLGYDQGLVSAKEL
jgi:hypothetical protein